jgi:hypothetical protein
MAFLVSLALLTFEAALPIALFPLSVPAAWKLLAHAMIFVGAGSMMLFLYLFPNGRFVPRWTRWLGLASIGVLAPSIFFPYSLLSLWRYPLLYALVGLPLASVPLLLQVYRYRRVSDSSERQQTKWVVLGVVTAMGGYGMFLLLDALLPSALLASLFVNTAFFVLLLLIPVSIAVAVLRYRLYDIDILINRTLVYGSLTATLVALYFGGIVVLQRVFISLTGEKSTVAVVASTLFIAALFTPLRRRIQSFIDRRFYRRKYDAIKTLEDFSTRLREETDLEALNSELVGVVRETMQPEHVSLWLRPHTIPKGGQTD